MLRGLRLRDVQILELLVVDVVANFERRGEPAIEKDANAETEVEVDLRLVRKVSVVGIDDCDRTRRYRADSADDIRVVMEDEVTERGRELSIGAFPSGMNPLLRRTLASL